MEPRIFAIVLAAGSSSRFGAAKQLATYRGEALVARACDLAESVCGPRTILVTGAGHLSVVQAKPTQGGFIVVNEQYASGMASSITCGVKAIADIADAVLLLLADQPLITEEHLRSLLALQESAADTIVASQFADTVGPPVIFPRACFEQLMELRGDRGARSLLDEQQQHLRTIRFDDAAVDIDRPADLDAIN